MDDSSEDYVNVVQYPSKTMAALGYQVISIVGNRVLDTFSNTVAIPGAPIKENQSTSTSPIPNTLTKDRRWLRKNSAAPAIPEDLPVFTLDDVSYHDNPYDCWVILYDLVYDITSFLRDHPGGQEVILEYAGRDATVAFRSAGHSKMAEESLVPYLVGILTDSERIWTRFPNIRAESL